LSWIENDELFKKELLEGYRWQQYVADYFGANGFEAVLPELAFRNNISEIKTFANRPDLLLSGRYFEVKSRRLPFTCPQDFPYRNILVDTVSSWEVKDPKPRGYICVSTITGKIICLSDKTYSKWTTREQYDRVRCITDTFYLADRALWVPVTRMVDSIRKHGI
jgi:hypothetical protein